MRRKWVLFFLLLLLLRGRGAFGWSFGVCGVSGDDKNRVLPRILSAVEKSDMEFLLHTGNLERSGGIPAWQTFRERTKRFSKPLYLVIGKQELRGATAEEFARFFGLPDASYSFTHKDAHFVILDNAGGALPDSRLEWLDRDLAAHSKATNGVRFLVVAMHIPPRTDNLFPHGTARNYDAQSGRLREILAKHQVDLLLSSHEPMPLVEDWGGIKVIVSGGAGSPMVPFPRFGFYRIDLEKGRVKEKYLRIKSGKGSPSR